MARHAESHATLSKLEAVFEPLSTTDGRRSHERRSAAMALSSAMRSKAAEKAAEENRYEDAEQAAKSAQKAPCAGKRIAGADETHSPHTPASRWRRPRQGDPSTNTDAAAKREAQGCSGDAAAIRPKRSKTALTLFKDKQVPSFLKDNLDVKTRDFGVTMEAMGTEWKQLGEEEKQKYTDKSTAGGS